MKVNKNEAEEASRKENFIHCDKGHRLYRKSAVLAEFEKKNSRVGTTGNSSMENQLAEFLALPSLHKGQYHSITLVMREL